MITRVNWVLISRSEWTTECNDSVSCKRVGEHYHEIAFISPCNLEIREISLLPKFKSVLNLIWDLDFSLVSSLQRDSKALLLHPHLIQCSKCFTAPRCMVVDITFRSWGIIVKAGVKLLLPDCEMPDWCVTSVVTVTCHAVTERPRHVCTPPLTTGYCLHQAAWSHRPAHTDPEHGAHSFTRHRALVTDHTNH